MGENHVSVVLVTSRARGASGVEAHSSLAVLHVSCIRLHAVIHPAATIQYTGEAPRYGKYLRRLQARRQAPAHILMLISLVAPSRGA